ncbi:MAG: hypothetical protein WBC19_06400 [Pyrinomonadaceae bacterium]|nr:hypothetical protein [Pyrinomonadaceae bacterium]
MSFFSLPIKIILMFLVLVAHVGVAMGVVKDGQVDSSINISPIITGGNGRIYYSANLPDGKVIVGGNFLTICGGSSKNIARLNSDGSFDPSFLGSADNTVLAVFPLLNGQMLISGDFLNYGGVARRRIARLNSDGSLDTTFNPNFGTDYVQIVATQPDEKIIVNGTFLTIGGISRKKVARLNPDGSVDLSFNAGTGTDTAGVYKAIVQLDGKILFAGRFSTYNEIPRNGILRINSDGSVDATFVPNIPGDSHEFFDMSSTPEGKVYLVGYNTGSNTIYRLNTNGSLDNSFNTANATTADNARIYSVLAQPDGKVLIGGNFGGIRTDAGLYNRYRLFRFNSDGSVDGSFEAQAGTSLSSGGVRSLALQTGDRILVGGDFPQLNGVYKGGIGRLNLDSSLDSTFIGFFGSPTSINAFHVNPNGTIFVGGGFDALGDSFGKYVARLRVDGSVDPTYQLDSRVDNVIRTISSQPDGKILLGGESGSDFSRIPSKGIWRLNSDGSLDTTLDARIGTLEFVGTIAVQADGKVLVGGNFTKINNINRRALARLNSDGSLDTSFLPDVGGLSVSKVVVQPDGKILVAGGFTTFNGTAVRNIVRLNTDGTLDASFNIGTGTNTAVNALLVRTDGKIYLGGGFSSFNGIQKPRLVRLLPDGNLDPGFKTVRVNGNITAICESSGGKIIVGGVINSTVTGAATRQGVLRLLSDGSVDYSFDVKGVTRNGSGGEVWQLGVQSDGKIIASGQFEAINGAARSGFARLLTFPNPTPAFSDFDGDGKTDLSVLRPSTGVWHQLSSYFNQVQAVGGIASDDVTVPADFDGDFLTDFAIYRPSTAEWFILHSSDDTVYSFQFGLPNDIPVPGDYDGDGKADLAVWRNSNGNWHILGSQSGLQMIQFGQPGDEPVLGDYDGDRIYDLAFVRRIGGQMSWHRLRMDGRRYKAMPFGTGNDVTAPGDYDGDGTVNFAIQHHGDTPSSAATLINRKANNRGQFSVQLGIGTDIVVPGNYDGDNKTDWTIVHDDVGGSSNLLWSIRYSSTGTVSSPIPFGLSGDRPASARYRSQPLSRAKPIRTPKVLFRIVDKSIPNSTKLQK